jgi:hypothetical protein
MRKINILIILLLLGFATTVAQEKQQAPAEGVIAADGLPLDPQLSQEDKELMMEPLADNPAKIDPLTMNDPLMSQEEMPVEEGFGDENAKVTDELPADPQMENEKLQTKRESSPGNGSLNMKSSQPEGNKEGEFVDYRNMPDGSSAQEPGETSSYPIPNYRDLQGPNTQPEGDKLD